MKTRKELEKEYISSYDRHEGIFIIAILIVALGMIVLGFALPI